MSFLFFPPAGCAGCLTHTDTAVPTQPINADRLSLLLSHTHTPDASIGYGKVLHMPCLGSKGEQIS